MKIRYMWFVIVMLALNVQAGVLSGWEVTGVDVKDGTGIETNIAPFTFNATTSDVANVSARLTLGAGVNPGTTTGNYGFKISASDATNSLAGAIAKNHYMEFSITVGEGYELNLGSIEMKGEATETGCSNVVLMTSIDGFIAGQQIATAANANTTGGFDTDASGFGAPIDLSSPKYQGLTGEVAFRIYGWGSSTNSGAGETRIRTFATVSDDLVVFGEVVEASGSGEPSLSMSVSNESAYVYTDFDGAATTNYVLQSCTNLVSNTWDTVTGAVSADTNISVDATHQAKYFRIVVE